MTAVSVHELRLAWAAVQTGRFRSQWRAPVWRPGHQVLPVLGCHGTAGATTVALALATAVHAPARVVEACSITTSGLAGCATAELGQAGHGWLRGTREQVVLDRAGEPLANPGQVPVPTEAATGMTVLDAGWDPSLLFFSQGWLSRAVWGASDVVLVTRATVPAMRRLETTLHLLGQGPRPLAAIIGPPRRKWPRVLRHGMGEKTRELDGTGRLLELPEDPALTVRGLDTTALPVDLVAGAAQILQLSGLAATTHDPTRGN